jgi:hypothetical protein
VAGVVVWLIILGIIALALAAAALMDVRNKRMGITIDPQRIRERRLEQRREVRRAISPLSRKLHPPDRDRDRKV